MRKRMLKEVNDLPKGHDRQEGSQDANHRPSVVAWLLLSPLPAGSGSTGPFTPPKSPSTWDSPSQANSTSLPGCVNDRKKQLRQLFRSLQGQKKTPN